MPTVLVVDDDADFAADVAAVLHGKATIHRVHGSGAAASWMLRSLPDLLWLEINLPCFFAPSGALEGIALVRMVRERIAPDLPVLVVSDHVSPESREELERLGVDRILTKPPDWVEVLAVLRSVVQRGRSPNGSRNKNREGGSRR